MVGKFGDFLAGLDIPFHASHVSRGSQNTAVVDKPAAGQVTGMTRQFPSHACGAIALLIEVVDGANVVEAAAGHEVSAGSIGAGHDPRRSQGNGVDFVRRVGIPDDELAIL